MLPLMSEDLTAGVQHVVAVRSDAVDVVAGAAEPAVAVRAGLVLHVLLEAVLGQRFVFYVIGLVFLWKIGMRRFDGLVLGSRILAVDLLD